jgi:branched-chain amino acid transport system substrate-binding protein
MMISRKEGRILLMKTQKRMFRTPRFGLACFLALGAFLIFAAGPIQAQEPIVLGTLCPLTGAGGPYGPGMEKVVTKVVEEINENGGIYGRPIKLFHEDSQTNPEAAVRAARKLIDVNKVNAIMGTWASAVTMAIAPLCWENKVFDISVSGADAISELKDDDYIFRTQPNSNLQGQIHARFALQKGWKKVAYMALQTPFAQTFGDAYKAEFEKGGGKITDFVIYEANKASYRSELTKVLATKPEAIELMSYLPDATVIAKELYKIGYEGKLLGPNYAINQKLVDNVGAEVAEGLYSIDPATNPDSPAYRHLKQLVADADIHAYSTQSYDHINLIALAIAAGKDSSGTGIRNALRKVSNPPGQEVGSFLEGTKPLSAGKKINYQGASGDCDFDERGDILSRPFSFYQVQKGKVVTIGRLDK